MSYPTREEVGAKIEQMAAEGVMSDQGLLRIAMLASRLSTIGIDEQAIAGAIMLIYPKSTPVIKQAAKDMQADPLLSVRPPSVRRTKGQEE